MADEIHRITKETLEKLEAEYLYMTTVGRTEIARTIEAARLLGDLSENGDYHAAKDEQGKMEGRIRQLTQILRESKVGTPPTADSGVAGPGMVVTVKDADGDTETFLIGSREEAATANVDVFSAASPIGKALTGAHPGDTVEYETPNGKTLKVTLVSAKPFAG
jgi:transcription elongation factor GreA